MSRFGFGMDWLRCVVLWIIRPDILQTIGKVFKKIFSFARKQPEQIASPNVLELPSSKIDDPPNSTTDINPSCSVPVLNEYTLTGTRLEPVLNQNCSCKNLLRDFCLNQAGLSDDLCTKLPKIFMPSRMENLRLKTMEALNLDRVYKY